MSKARTLANLISDGAELADGQISVAEVVGAAPLANPTFTGTATGTFSGPLTGDVTGNLTGAVTGNIAGDLDLTAIAKDISDTAVDVFVYDTSKDSDGGAWRKRTQHTSWYNEAASSTRGSRKEFPAVAVIVAEDDHVTIYDGDDPDLPMWMVFDMTSTSNDMFRNQGVNSLFALNGTLSACLKAGYGFALANMVSDMGALYTATASSGPYKGSIALRNNGSAFTFNYGVSIANNTVNDVAMTVLPNAPIDYATGLPVPTIAVATDGGVSVIKDDGTVVDINDTLGGTRPTDHLVIRGNDITIYNRNNGTVQQFFDALNLSADNTNECKYNYTYNGGGGGTENVTAILRETLGGSILVGGGETYRDLNVANADGLSKIHDGYDREFSAGSFSIFDSSVAYITTDYNTGWMNGDIKLATLSDTDDTDVVGSDLAPANNAASVGSEANATTGFESGNTSTFASSSSQALNGTYSINVVANANSAYVRNSSAVTLEVGKVYTASVAVYVANGDSNTGIAVRYGTTNNGAVEYGISATITAASWTIYTRTFTATSTNFFIYVGESGAGNDPNYFIDAFSVRLAEEDRSVNGNGLQVFGTVTKSAVATGADLVGYSGFSTSNYLQQPYNADLQFGTGDFCFTYWVKFSSVVGESIYSTLGTGTSSGTEGVAGNTAGSGTLGFAVYTNGIQSSGRTNCGFTTAPSVGVWHCVQNIRRGGTLEIWINGKLDATAANTSDINATDSFTRLGGWSSGSVGDSISLALFRVSKTAPSPEQIAKIYEDEKHLFQEGAQATLYGSSDAVTALAHDDITDLLHVGTSAGRSVFQGLRRVDNTTDAVGATISASNGLVAED